MAFIGVGGGIGLGELKAGKGVCERGRRRRVVGPRMDRVDEGIYDSSTSPEDVRVVVFGATGYIGRYVTTEFANRGYQVSAFTREKSGVKGKNSVDDVRKDFPAAVQVITGNVSDRTSVANAFDVESNAKSTVMVSCLASRSGGIEDSNKIDYHATLNCLEEGYTGGARHFILLSAICVEKPLLEFQRAKLKFEAKLQELAEKDESFSYSIVRPTAFFKSLAGQVKRVKDGSAYIMFGDGELSKCNAISERDLADFIANCCSDPSKRNQILPVGGPGKPVTPKEQAEILFRLLDREPKFSKAPIGVMDVGISVLDFVSKLLPGAKDAAEFARIGKYYAVQDMVGPEYGNDTLEDFFKDVIENGLEGQELGSAAVFSD
ncbi:hypothetical protein NDN08_007879 [Rhodosorus marinus]|uniref:Divinyl chlorophyllide a 8-vinyl-reductase, chloroplastic n=1 Tax=Rhodosorus marinus TaxID=101924 RepID=A0AAV8UYT4_9RHOD|nr:hypothetical protein NDN08_007879 [Rhodosorus marinus]